MYVNIRSGKPLNTISERAIKADLCPVSFWGSSEVYLLCRAQGKVWSKVAGKVKAAAISTDSKPPPELHRDISLEVGFPHFHALANIPYYYSFIGILNLLPINSDPWSYMLPVGLG